MLSAKPYIARPKGRIAALLADPPEAYGPVPMWWWSGAPLEPARLRWQLERLVEGGVRQVVVMNLAPSGPLYGALADEPEFFTDQWWEVLLGVCRDADELGVRLWFYDQLGFSGADLQGRLVARVPAFRGWALARADTGVDGGSGDIPSDAVVLSRRPTSVVYAVRCGFDYLDANASAALIESAHGEFERRLGAHLGTTVVGSFQDELASMPSWTARFADEFEERRGYDLLPVLDALWDSSDRAHEQVRADYQRTRAELAEEAFFRPLHEWHETRGLAVGCDQQHPARAGYPLEATQQYADYLRTHRWFSAPGSDHWGDAKVHSSIAHLYDRPRTWVEAFHTTGWGGTLEETYDWLVPWLRAGATLYNPHAVYYSSRGSQWEWAPPSTCWRQPYWRHYARFAETVTRLCAAMSWGDHVCDVGVLYPTTTAAAELSLGLGEELLGQPAGTSGAQDAYLDVVGRMTWWEPTPGALDDDRRDFDVLDDDSVVRAEIVDGALRIGRERYRAVVLPGVRLLEPATRTALAALVRDGGVVVAVGAVPEGVPGVRRVENAAGLAEALADVERQVDAPVPTLLRTDGESAVLLVVGAAPMATRPATPRAWKTHGYTFDARRYRRSVPVTVRAVHLPVAVCDPETGAAAALDATSDDGVVTVEVPLTVGPAVLVLFGPAAAEVLAESAAASMPPEHPSPGVVIDDGWTAELLPTLDNRWADIDVTETALLPARVWQLEQLGADGGWERVRVTYGPCGEVSGPGAASPRGLECSPVHGTLPLEETYEPRGFVPEEFLDAGLAQAGESASFTLPVVSAQPGAGRLVVGSTSDVDVRWNGDVVPLTGGPYYREGEVDAVGADLLELTLTAPSERRLRASWVLRSAPEPTPRPQWLAAGGSAPTTLRRDLGLTGAPTAGLLQLGTVGRVVLRVNGVELARHGETDNYAHVRQPRVRRYRTVDVLRPGPNVLEVDLLEAESAVIVDAVLEIGGVEQWLVTDGTWMVEPGHLVPTGVAEVPHDPRWAVLRARPHPLPRGHELAGDPPDENRLGAGAAGGPAHSVDRTFRFRLPPGAVALRLPAPGIVAVSVDGASVNGSGETWRFHPPVAGGTWCTVIVRRRPGAGPDGGALWSGPVGIEVSGPAPMPVGDWTEHGLSDYSGGVRYRRVLAGRTGAATLDLGQVRGTVEVRLDGRPIGTRLWTPYRFALDGLRAEGSLLEVDVYGTLGPHQAAASPTTWVLPGQRVSGMLGPVTLH